MAVALKPSGFGRVEGTLARAALAGGPPRELAEGVACRRLVARRLGPRHRQVGTADAMCSSTRSARRSTIRAPVTSRISGSPRVGDAIAALVHPVSGDTAGDVVLVDLEGRARTLSSGWNSVLGVGLVAGWRGMWFTGDTHWRGAGSSCGDSIGAGAAAALGACDADAARRVERRRGCSSRAMPGAQA